MNQVDKAIVKAIGVGALVALVLCLMWHLTEKMAELAA